MGRRVGMGALLTIVLALAGVQSAQADTNSTLQRYARGTWASFVAMTDAQSGLPADSLGTDGTTSVQTSTTNIGAYMWSAVAAERLGILGHKELVARMRTTLHTLAGMERGGGGQFYNWYDHRSGAKLTAWPPDPAQEFHPILSSVDNGWLAVGLRIVQQSVPALSNRAGRLYDAMNFGFYYRPDVN